MDLRSLAAAIVRLLLTLVGGRTPPSPRPTGGAREAPGPGPAATGGVAVGAHLLPAPPAEAAHALRLDAASVLVISEPPAAQAAGEAHAALLGPNPVTVVFFPTPGGSAHPGAARNGGRARDMAPPRGAARSGHAPSALGGPRPWWRPAGLPTAPSDGLRGSWDGGREPWFTGRWAR